MRGPFDPKGSCEARHVPVDQGIVAREEEQASVATASLGGLGLGFRVLRAATPIRQMGHRGHGLGLQLPT